MRNQGFEFCLREDGKVKLYIRHLNKPDDKYTKRTLAERYYVDQYNGLSKEEMDAEYEVVYLNSLKSIDAKYKDEKINQAKKLELEVPENKNKLIELSKKRLAQKKAREKASLKIKEMSDKFISLMQEVAQDG